MKQIAIFFFILFTFASPLFAQLQLEGKVLDANTKQGIELAVVVLRSLKDTTQVKNTVTDKNGEYLFTGVRVGRYELQFYILGYESKVTPIRLIMPSAGSVVKRQDTLREENYDIGDVRVEGTRSRTADKRIFTFSKEDVKQAYTSFELIKTLPVVREDLISDGLKGLRGGSVAILINGVKATYNDVRMIPKEKIKRIEAYEIPPARFRNVESVLNIVTHHLDDGISLGFEVNHAFSTGFGNDNAYFSWIRGNHKLSAEYGLSYRNYRDRRMKEEFRYTLSGLKHQLTYNKKDHFGYTTHSPRLRYSFVNDEKTVVEIVVQPSFENRFNHGTGTGLYQKETQTDKALRTLNHNKTRTFNPSVDLYLWKRLTDKDEITLNLVGTSFGVNTKNQNKEENISDGLVIYGDDRTLENQKYSAIGEIIYTRNFGSIKWNTGYEGSFAFLHSKAKNLYGDFNYRSRFFSQYAYTELSGLYRRFSYRFSVGIKHTNNIVDKQRTPQWGVTPKVTLSYMWGGGHTTQLHYFWDLETPGINELSTNISNRSIDILETGNPKVIGESAHAATLVHTFENQYLSLNCAYISAYASNPFVEYYEERGGKLWNTVANGYHTWQNGGLLAATIKPFGNNYLQLQGYIIPVYNVLHSEYINVSRWTWGNNLNLKLNYKNFTLTYQYRVPFYNLERSDISLSENMHHLKLRYQWNKWQFSGGILFIGEPSHYHNVSLAGSRVFHTTETWIYDNKNMITLGVAFHFQSGQQAKQYEKLLNNSDTSAPTR